MPRPLNSSSAFKFENEPEFLVDLCSVVTACAKEEQATWQLLQELLDEAHRQHVHEIHIEPDEECWRLRLKSPFAFSETRLESIAVLGDLLSQLQQHLWGSCNSMLPSRGWFEFLISDTHWLLQLDRVPSARGDTFMITLLRPSKNPPPRLDALALSRAQQSQIRSIIHKKKGLVLLASDLTQSRLKTARALIQDIIAPDKKIVCAENPGYPLLPRTTQLTVDCPPTSAQIQAWTAMCQLGCNTIVACQPLNDDMDRQMIRYASKETLVIQGVNVDNAADAVDQMLSNGVRCEALARTLKAIVVQRQVRCICRYCRQSRVPDDDGTAWLAEHSPIKPGNINDWLRHRMRSSFSQADGCKMCHETGHGDILDIYDIVIIDDAIRDALYDADIRYALSLLHDQTTMSMHLLNLAQEGIISLSEALRIAPLAASND